MFFSKSDMSRLRLAAGGAILKLAQEPCYHDIITPEQFQLCGLVINVRFLFTVVKKHSLINWISKISWLYSLWLLWHWNYVFFLLKAMFVSTVFVSRMSAIKFVRFLLRSCTWLLSNCCCPLSTWLFSPSVPRTRWRSAVLMPDSASSKTFPSAESTSNKTHLLRVGVMWRPLP